MIVLVTGTPGSGKTLFVVSKIMQLKKDFPDRKIYSDIDGLTIEGVEKSPDDWRTTEENSIVIYDEAQQHERFRSGTSANKDEIVQALQVHRHTGHDIYFITQSPRFLNAFVLDLVGEHYHLHRPYGASLASVYYWRSVRKQPQSQSSREVAENEFLFKYPKDLFKYYQSATQHNVKLKIPKKLIYVLIAIVAIGVFVYMTFFNEKTQNMIAGRPMTEQVQQEKQQNKQSDNTKNQSLSNLEQECRKGVNVEKPECVEWFNNLTKNNGSVKENEETYVSYNPVQPYELKEIQDQIKYEVTAKPLFSGCMFKNGRYVAYTQQGTILNEVSQADCKRLIQDADRPFNYFANNNRGIENAQPNSQGNYTEFGQQAYKRDISQQTQIANNYVDPQLQRNPLNGANAL